MIYASAINTVWINLVKSSGFEQLWNFKDEELDAQGLYVSMFGLYL